MKKYKAISKETRNWVYGTLDETKSYIVTEEEKTFEIYKYSVCKNIQTNDIKGNLLYTNDLVRQKEKFGIIQEDGSCKTLDKKHIDIDFTKSRLVGNLFKQHFSLVDIIENLEKLFEKIIDPNIFSKIVAESLTAKINQFNCYTDCFPTVEDKQEDLFLSLEETNERIKNGDADLTKRILSYTGMYNEDGTLKEEYR